MLINPGNKELSFFLLIFHQIISIFLLKFLLFFESIIYKYYDYAFNSSPFPWYNSSLQNLLSVFLLCSSLYQSLKFLIKKTRERRSSLVKKRHRFLAPVKKTVSWYLMRKFLNKINPNPCCKWSFFFSNDWLLLICL